MFVNFTIGEKTYSCKELEMGNYKEILKATYGDSPNQLTVSQNICHILSNLFSKPYNYFYKEINVLEVYLLLLHIRVNSLGNLTDVTLTENKQKTNVKINFNKILKRLTELFIQCDNVELELNKKITISLSLPSLEKLLDKPEDYTSLYTKKISIKQSSTNTLTFTEYSDIQSLLDNISAKHTTSLIQGINQIIENINKVNLLDFTNMKNQILVFSPVIDSFVWFVKFIYSESLDVLYNNLFHLSYTGKIDLNYLEKCTPGEYFYFTNKLQQTLKEQQTSSQNQEGFTHKEPLMDAADYFK